MGGGAGSADWSTPEAVAAGCEDGAFVVAHVVLLLRTRDGEGILWFSFGREGIVGWDGLGFFVLCLWVWPLSCEGAWQ